MSNENIIVSGSPIKRFPVNGTFELTIRCNLHCKMCLFRRDDSEYASIKQNELTTDEWIDMARQAAEAGTGYILVTGGEPMLRQDFCEIWEGIYRQGFLMELYTNATLVTDRIMDTLKRYPPHKLGITLYGSNPDIYKKVCGNENAFQMAFNGIKQLLKLPSKIQFRSTIIKDNYSDLSAIEALVRREFGEEFLVTQPRIVTRAVRGGCADVESCRLDPETNIKLALRRSYDKIRECVGDSYDENNAFLHMTKVPHNVSSVSPATLLGCNAGFRDYTITWNGRLIGCQMLGIFETNALSEGLLPAWNRFPSVIPEIKPNIKCQSCMNKDICNGCLATTIAETQKIDGCPDYFCRDANIIKNLIR